MKTWTQIWDSASWRAGFPRVNSVKSSPLTWTSPTKRAGSPHEIFSSCFSKDDSNIMHKLRASHSNCKFGHLVIHTYIYYSAHSPRGFSVADYIKYLNCMSIFTVFLIIFLTIYPNPPCQVFPCWRKPENPEKTHNFRQSVDELLPRAIRCSIQGSNPLPQ